MQYVAIVDVNSDELAVKKLLGLPLLSRITLTLRDLGFKTVIILNKFNIDLKEALDVIDDRGGVNYIVLNQGDRFSIENALNSDKDIVLAFIPINVCPESVKEIIKANLEKLKEFKNKENIVFKITKAKDSGVGVLLGFIKNGNWSSKLDSLDDPVKILETQRRIVELHSDKLIILDDKKSIKSCERITLRNLGKPDDGIISRYINRKISTFLSKYLVGTRVTPNAISIFSFILMIIAAVVFAFYDKFWILAGVLAQFASIIDGCDGEIARLRFKPSAFGALLDTILDRYSDILLLAGIAYYYSFIYPSMIIVAFLCVSLSATLLSGLFRKEFTLRFGTAPEPSFLLQITRRDMRIFAIFVGALLGYLFHVVLGLSILIHVIIVYKYLKIASKSLN